MHVTNTISNKLVRLQLWVGLEEYQKEVVSKIINYLKSDKY